MNALALILCEIDWNTVYKKGIFCENDLDMFSELKKIVQANEVDDERYYR